MTGSTAFDALQAAFGSPTARDLSSLKSVQRTWQSGKGMRLIVPNCSCKEENCDHRDMWGQKFLLRKEPWPSFTDQRRKQRPQSQEDPPWGSLCVCDREEFVKS